MTKWTAIVGVIAVALAGAGIGLVSGQAAAPPVPEEYAKLYEYLSGQIGLVERHFTGAPAIAAPASARQPHTPPGPQA